jgi:capsular polysaccharide biosynthesis protein
MQRLKKQEAAIQQQISSYQANVDAVPVLETQLAELTRNYDASRQNYQSLLDKTFSAGMAEDLERKQQAEHFRILDPATPPQKPFKPKRLPLMAAAVVLGFLLSAGAAIGFDFLKGCVKTESELKALLPTGVRVLGTIPPITSRLDVRRSRLVAIQSLAFVGATLAALVLFLIKAKPIL